MKERWTKGLAGALVVCLVMSGYAQDAVTTITDFSVPEYDDDGVLISELRGDYADILPDGRARIRGLQIQFYRDGNQGMQISAPECEYHEQQKTASSSSDVRIANDSMVVTGNGFSWNAADERLVIESKVRVELKNVRKQVKTGEKS